MGDTWVNGRTWRPTDWSVFRENVRTNNNLEGYHRGINGRANRASHPFYVMVPLLRDEARDVTITARLVSESMVTKNEREVYKNTHSASWRYGTPMKLMNPHQPPGFSVRSVTSLEQLTGLSIDKYTTECPRQIFTPNYHH